MSKHINPNCQCCSCKNKRGEVLTGKNNPNFRHGNILTKEFLEKEYIINKKNTPQIVKETKISKTTVCRYLNKYNIPRRTSAESIKTSLSLKGKCCPSYIDGRSSKKYYCTDCEKLGIKTKISISSGLYGKGRCQACYIKFIKISKNHPRYGTISPETSNRQKGKNNPNYIDGRCSKKYYCIEGGGHEIVYYNWVYGNKRCYSCAMKLRWKNKEYREKNIEALWKGRLNKFNNPEKYINILLTVFFPDKYIFSGAGKRIIGGFCPDFIDKKNKKIIELYGDYWHNMPGAKEKDKRRLIEYTNAGYSTLIIWEHELKDLNRVVENITTFNKE